MSPPYTAFKSIVCHAEILRKLTDSATSSKSLGSHYQRLSLTILEQNYSSVVHSSSNNLRRVWKTVNTLFITEIIQLSSLLIYYSDDLT